MSLTAGVMRPSAYTVLSFLGESQMALPPKVIAWNMEDRGIEIGYSTVRDALPRLQEQGLVEKPAENEGYYRITEQGRQYLSGNIDLNADA